jgi:hypothetical protein
VRCSHFNSLMNYPKISPWLSFISFVGRVKFAEDPI